MQYPIVLNKGPFSVFTPGLKAIYSNGKWWFHVQSLMAAIGYSMSYIANVRMLCKRLPKGSCIYVIRTSKPTSGAKDVYTDFDGWQCIIRGGNKTLTDDMLESYLNAKKSMALCNDDSPELNPEYAIVSNDA